MLILISEENPALFCVITVWFVITIVKHFKQYFLNLLLMENMILILIVIYMGWIENFFLMCKLRASNNSCTKNNKENSKDICKARFQNSLNFQIKKDCLSKKLLLLIQFLIIMVNFLEHKWDHLLFILV